MALEISHNQLMLADTKNLRGLARSLGVSDDRPKKFLVNDIVDAMEKEDWYYKTRMRVKRMDDARHAFTVSDTRYSSQEDMSVER